jgi:succinate-acetate transporter protein
VLLLVAFWLLTFALCPCLLRFKRALALRFTHMTRVLFRQPAIGTMMANVPALITAGLLKYM